MAGSDRQKRDKASRRADGRQNAFRSHQCSVLIGGDEMRRWLAGISCPRARIEQIDLPPGRGMFHQIRGRRAEGYIARIGAHRRRVAFLVCRRAIGCRREQGGMRPAVCASAFAGIPQKDLRAIILDRGVGNIATVQTERRRLLGDQRRRRRASRSAWRTPTRGANREGCGCRRSPAATTSAHRGAAHRSGRRWIKNRHTGRQISRAGVHQQIGGDTSLNLIRRCPRKDG